MFYTVNDPVVDMREEPNLNAKVVSQALFSEQVQVERREGDWALIQTPDGYQGWIISNALAESQRPYIDPNGPILSRLAGHLYARPDIEFGPKKTLPYGSKLKSIEWEDPRWVKILLPDGNEGYIQKGDLSSSVLLKDKKKLAAFSKQFLGLPYTWGGRSSFGFDCSGFVQMNYAQMGILLKRDSKDQIGDPRLAPISLENLEPGDLVFFGKTAERVQHVGLFLGKGKMIHSSSKENKPYLRISSLSDFEWSGDPRSAYPFRAARQLFK